MTGCRLDPPGRSKKDSLGQIRGATRWHAVLQDHRAVWPHSVPSAGLSLSSWLRLLSVLSRESWSRPHEEPRAEVKQQRRTLGSAGHVLRAVARGQSCQTERHIGTGRDIGTNWES